MQQFQGYFWSSEGSSKGIFPTTLKDLGKSEAFLEEIIAENIGILGLESRSSGIFGPFIVFRQKRFKTSQGRFIQPDLILLTNSGHIIIVEVKLYQNPELRDRRVISQIIDYSAFFASLSEKEIFSALQSDEISIDGTWVDLITRLFSEQEDIEELADLILQRFQEGEIHLVIACDKAPVGLRDIIEGVSNQKTLAFDFSVVEVSPFVFENESDQIIFLPTIKINTDTVLKTVVTVKYEKGTPKPEITVNVDSVQAIENSIRKIRTGASRKNTPVNNSLPLINKELDDLIKAKRISPLWCWRGFDLVSELKMEKIGRCKIDLSFYNFAEDDYRLEQLRTSVNLGFGIAAETFNSKRSELVQEIIKKHLKSKPDLLTEEVHFTKRGAEWFIEDRNDSSFELTEEEIIRITVKYFRILADLLPFSAIKT